MLLKYHLNTFFKKVDCNILKQKTFPAQWQKLKLQILPNFNLNNNINIGYEKLFRFKLSLKKFNPSFKNRALLNCRKT